MIFEMRKGNFCESSEGCKKITVTEAARCQLCTILGAASRGSDMIGRCLNEGRQERKRATHPGLSFTNILVVSGSDEKKILIPVPERPWILGNTKHRQIIAACVRPWFRKITAAGCDLH